MSPQRILVVLVAALTSAACGSGGGDTGAGDELAEAICQAAADARAGDRSTAVATFEDRHAGLHVYADRLAESDRQHAGEVLRAKQGVEAELDGDGPAELAAALDDLASALAGAPEPCL